MEAVKKGTTAVAVVGKDRVVLGVEKKATAKLQDPRTIRKIYEVDDNIILGFAGLTADAVVLVDMTRHFVAGHNMSFPNELDVETVTRYIARKQQVYTQSGGVRPFGISALIAGFDPAGGPRLFQTDPSGTYSAWKANATGRNSKPVMEFLEKNFEEGASGDDAVKLTIKALMEVVDSGSNNIEIAVLDKGKRMRVYGDAEVDAIVEIIEKEKAAAKEEEAQK
eukprot:CAMPEP_0177648834 /NCGR_PEP_ID=MMETSP0447-20121125/11041_1 /TAXON_ID=0 /ORGANISM="Stygamoeba regulata, Strain BSH-02190019" /LENGTH=222 /DNA_ID=CAMNT_0019151505 /DNA_START=133 /DNA_END=801 /DNA_ORIENTATION=+